jgi:hypothetical protein
MKKPLFNKVCHVFNAVATCSVSVPRINAPVERSLSIRIQICVPCDRPDVAPGSAAMGL